MCAVHLRLMVDLSYWLGEREETIAGLSAPLLAEFIGGRRAAGQRTGLSMRALRPLAEYLRGTGAVPPEEPALPSGPVEEAIAEYASYLHAERGLATITIERETALVRPFLAGRVREGGFKDLVSLTAAPLAGAVPAPAGCKLGGLPRHLTQQEAARMLESCDLPP